MALRLPRDHSLSAGIANCWRSVAPRTAAGKFCQEGDWKAMQDLQSGASPRVGDIVSVRSECWRVTGTEHFDACEVVALTGAGRSNQGAIRRILVPFDRPTVTRPDRRPHVVSVRRWRRRLRTLIASDGGHSRLQAAAGARIDLFAYQLAPALALVGGDASRVLIADEVGLGKTVQTGLAIGELLFRGCIDRVLVLCPSGLREQWVAELAARFGLTATSIDAAAIARRRAELPPDVNPWSADTIAVASIDFVKRADVLSAVAARRWDLVVIDEAHHATSSSDRGKAASALCARAAHVILLSATPHNGDADAFARLCALGARGEPLKIFRRTRRDAGWTGHRRSHVLRVAPTDAERRMHAALNNFERAVRRDRRSPDAFLALALLRKRALSSSFALLQSVDRRLLTLDGGPNAANEIQLSLPLGDDDAVEEKDSAPLWTVPIMSDPDRERTWLLRVRATARDALQGESKLRALTRLVRRAREPVLVFTEYRDTLMHVRAMVAAAAPMIHGGLSLVERAHALATFRARGGLLFATDAAGEGLNLQDACRVVVNLELPWNPVRLEQRIGRVDRIGQSRTVHAFHFVADSTSETRVMHRLRTRIGRARADIGAEDPLAIGPAAPHDAHGPLLDEGARRECNRLREVRRLGADALDVEHAAAPWILRSRRQSIRAWLGTTALLVLRSTVSDDRGRLAGSRLTPVLVPRSTVARFLRGLHGTPAELIDRHIVEWSGHVFEAHRTYWTLRLQRERAIATPHSDRGAEQQGGLFDRRVARAAEEDGERHRELNADRERRLAALSARCDALQLDPLQPVLLLEASHGPWCQWPSDLA